MRSESLRVEWLTPINKTLKRALKIKGEDYVVTLSSEFLTISRKGHRLGLELSWADLVSGETALAVAVHASKRYAQLAALILEMRSLVGQELAMLARNGPAGNTDS